MSRIQVALRVASAGGEGQDRAVWSAVGDGTLVVLADGAGGIAGGLRAAQRVIEIVTSSVDRHPPVSADDVADLLRAADSAMARESEVGEATAVVLLITPTRLYGASVGDSAAWRIEGERIGDLTAGQERKPLMGSADANPVSFDAEALGPATLLVSSDGLWKYAPRARIIEHSLACDLEAAADRLVSLPRLRSGDLPDDVALVLARAS